MTEIRVTEAAIFLNKSSKLLLRACTSSSLASSPILRRYRILYPVFTSSCKQSATARKETIIENHGLSSSRLWLNNIRITSLSAARTAIHSITSSNRCTK